MDVIRDRIKAYTSRAKKLIRNPSDKPCIWHYISFKGENNPEYIEMKLSGRKFEVCDRCKWNVLVKD